FSQAVFSHVHTISRRAGWTARRRRTLCWKPMPVEFIGMIATQEASEVLPLQGPVIDPEFTARFARAHEDAGFDRILIGYGSRWPDGWQVANHAVRATQRLKILLAHRPGSVAPGLTARQAVSFDH